MSTLIKIKILKSRYFVLPCWYFNNVVLIFIYLLFYCYIGIKCLVSVLQYMQL